MLQLKLLHSFFCGFSKGFFFRRLVEGVPTTVFFSMVPNFKSDNLSCLFPISKTYSKQNFHQRPDHCDRTPCIHLDSFFFQNFNEWYVQKIVNINSKNMYIVEYEASIIHSSASGKKVHISYKKPSSIHVSDS